MKTLRVNEIFYSIQGEGARAGTANVFIRLSGCKTKEACYASGIRCDTEFESGQEMKIDEILNKIFEALPKDWSSTGLSIIWTGGEPAQQLDDEIISYFKVAGIYQAIETSGLFPIPKGLDYVVVSPKVAEHVIKKNFPDGVNELRYIRHKGQSLPEPSIKADHYYLSPHSNGYELDQENLRHCIDLIKENPLWKLNLQMHKVWNVL